MLKHKQNLQTPYHTMHPTSKWTALKSNKTNLKKYKNWESSDGMIDKRKSVVENVSELIWVPRDL